MANSTSSRAHYGGILHYLISEDKMRHLFGLVLCSMSNGIKRMLVAISGLILVIYKELAKLGFILVCVVLFIVLTSFIKSIHPRYRLIPESREQRSSRWAGIQSQYNKNKPRFEKRFPKQNLSLKNSEPKGLTKKSSFIPNKITKSCKCAFTELEIKSIYKRLSWSNTQLEVETVDWLNRSIDAFWPSAKNLLLESIFKGSTMHKNRSKAKLAAKNLDLDRPKLSIYLSCRRHIELLRKTTSSPRTARNTFPGQQILSATIYCFRILMVYLKQFLVDHVLSLAMNRTEQEIKLGPQGGTSRSVLDLNNIVNYGKLKRRIEKNLELRRKHDRTKQCSLARSRSVISTPRSGLLSPITIGKMVRKRREIVKKMNHAQDTMGEQKGNLKIKNISLGESCPVISGMKFLTRNNNILSSIAYKSDKRLLPSDTKDMRLLMELTFRSSKDFNLLLDSVPIMNAIRLTKLDLILRCMVTINHIDVSSKQGAKNIDLNILETPDSILFPMINQLTVTLVDVPQINWRVRRILEKHNQKQNCRKSTESSKARGLTFEFFARLTKYADLVSLINNTYFKYLIECSLYLTLKWFQPFDIRIGDRFTIKTLY